MKDHQAPHTAWLTGGGTTGNLVRSTDWSKTSMGAFENWSPSLKTALQIVLNSRFQMFLWWGNDLLNFYNDAYAPTLGIRHPQAFGKSAKETWSEIWADLEPQVSAVMERGEATWNEELLLFLERSGFPEETYHTFSYSPISDDRGGIGGLYCAVMEVTAQVISRRRLQTLRDLSERSLTEAKTLEDACRAAAKTLAENTRDLPFALLYLLDEDGKTARLTESTLPETHKNRLPATIKIGSPEDIWQFKKMLTNHRTQLLQDIPTKIGSVQVDTWADALVQEAAVLPLEKAGTQEFPAGFLVTGISPRQTFDSDYQGFIELVAGHIGTALANAQAYEAERRRAEALAELDRAKTTFFSNISHEFRTPLTLMLGPLEEVLNTTNGNLPAAYRDNLDISHRNALRLLKLVNTLLDFSRIEANRVQARYEPVDLANFTKDLAGNFRSAIEKAGMDLVVKVEDLQEPVYVDREMWEKIVLNLLSNAFKYTLQGSITVQLKEENRHAVLNVTDTGVGIPESEIDNIFKRFHRVQNVQGRTHEGTGIGLSLVQELVNLHRGAIRVKSKPGRGSTFTVRIPLGKSHLPAAQVQSVGISNVGFANTYVEEAVRWTTDAGYQMPDARRKAQATSDKRQETPKLPNFQTSNEQLQTSNKERKIILLADDNADMRDYVFKLLNPHFEVQTATDGLDALEKIQQRTPDLVLSDIMMPRMDGLELLKQLKENLQTALTPVILLSARAGEEAQMDGLEAGADDYLIKPFSAKELLTRVRSHLKIAAVRQESEQRVSKLLLKAPIGIMLLRGKDFVYEMVNDTYLPIAQKTREELIGKSIFEVFPELEPQGLRTLFEQIMASGEPFPLNEHSLTLQRNGAPQLVYFNTVFQPLREEDGTIDRLMIMGMEVTGQVLARQKVEASEQRLQIATQAAQLGVWEYDVQNDSTIWEGNRMYEIFGFKPDDTAVNKNTLLQELIHPDDAAAFNQQLEDAFVTGNLHTLLRIRHKKTRQWIWLELYARVEYDASRNPVRMVGVTADITERKAAEEAIRESRERLQTVMNAAAMYAWEINPATNQLLTSDNFERVIGFELPKDTAQALQYLHPADLEETSRKLAESLERHTPFEHEFRLMHPVTQEAVWVSSQAIMVQDAATGQLYLSGISQNISERKRRDRNSAFLADLTAELSMLTDSEVIVRTAGKSIAEYLQLTHCLFVEVNQKKQEATVFYDYHTAEAPSLLGVYHLPDFHTEAERQRLAAGISIAIEDVEQDSPSKFAEAFEFLSIRALATAPYVSNGRWKFALSAQHRQPYTWRADEVELLSELAMRIYLRLERARAEAEVAQLNRRNRTILESITDAFFAVDRDWNFTYVNSQAEPLLQRKPDDLLGKNLWVEFAEAVGSTFYTQYHRAVNEQVSVAFEEFYPPLHTWFEVRAYPSPEGLSVYFHNINQRKQFERELQQSEARFKGLQQATPDGFMLFESVRNERGTIEDFRWLYVNPAAEQMVQRTADYLKGKLLLEEMPGNRSEGLFDAYVNVVENNQVWRREFQYQHEGLDHYFLSTAVKTGDGFAVSFSNISERKRAENATQYQKRLLEALTESVLDGILIVSPDGKMLHFNQQFLNIWHFPPEVIEAQSDKLALQYASEQTANPAAFLARVSDIYSQPNTQFREEMPMKDGRVYERFGAPIQDGDTRLAWVWTFRDITERKRAEENLLQSRNELRLITDAMPALISYVDADHRYRIVNKMYTQWFGHRPEAIVGKHVREVLGETVYNIILPNMKRVLGGEELIFEQLLPYKNAGNRFVHVNYIPDRQPDGSIRGYYALVQDISERKRRELNRAFLAEKNEMLANLSDEHAIVQTVAEKIGKYLQISRCHFTEFDADNTTASVVYDWSRDGESSMVGDYRVGDFFSEEDAAWLASGKQFVSNEVQSDFTGAAAERFERLGIGAFVISPYLSDGRWKASLTVHHSEAYTWRADELELLRDLANRVWMRIERVRAEAALQASEERYRAFVTQSSEAIWRFEIEQPLDVSLEPLELIERLYAHAYLAECNDAMAKMYGYEKCEDIVGARLGDMLPASDPANIAYLKNFIANDFKINDAESNEMDKDGQPRYFSNNLIGIVENGQLLRAWGIQRDITERRAAETALRESDLRLQLALEAAQIGIHEWHPQTGNIIWDDRLKNWWGLAVNRQPDYDFFMNQLHPDDHTTTQAAVNQALFPPGDGKYYTEYRVINAVDGEERWLAATGQMFFDKQHPVRLVGTVQDISERKRSEAKIIQLNQELTERVEELQKLLDILPVGVSIAKDASCMDLYANQYLLDIFQLGENTNLSATNAENSAQIGWRFFRNGEEIFDRDLPIQRAAFHEEKVKESEFEVFFSGTGKRLYFLGSATPLYNKAGKVRGAVGGFLNITERKLDEQRLKESEERLRQMADAMPQVVWIADEQGTVNYYNQRVKELDGVTQTAPDRWEWQPMLHADDIPTTLAAWQQAVHDKTPYAHEHRIRMRNGDYRWHLSRALPVLDEAGNLTKWYGTATDIHDRKRAEEQKDDFLRIAGHELRTPLTSLIGYISLLLKLPNHSDTALNFLKKSYGSTLKMRELITDFLDFTRVQRGDLPFQMEDFDLDELVTETVDNMQLSFPHHRILLQGSTGSTLHGDRSRLEQVLNNLLNNAIKYSPGKDEIEVRLSSDAQRVRLTVQDYGVGIAASELPNIFDRFYRADNTGKVRGMGLGLYLVKQIIDRHRGTIRVESQPGEGTTFFVELPLPPGGGKG